MNRERELLVNGLIAFLLEYCAKDSGKGWVCEEKETSYYADIRGLNTIYQYLLVKIIK